MSLNKSSESKLFNVPSVQREDPLVQRVSEYTASDKNNISYGEDRTAYQKYVDQMNYLALGFDNIVLEYDKLIDVLIKRAKLRNVSLPVSDKIKDSLQIANSIITIFGKEINSIDFEQYVELLKYEQIIASSHTASLVNESDPQLQLIKDKAAVISQPEVGAINTIKKEYQTYLNENDFDDLLIIDILVYNQYTAASNKSTIVSVSDTTDGNNILENNQPGPDEESKLEKIIDDCFPCLDRTIGILGELPKLKIWEYFINEMWKHFLSQLQQLARLKLALTHFGFGAAICSIIDILFNNLCLPDLVSLLAIIKMMIAKVKNALVGKFNLSAGAAINDLVTLIVSPVLDAILALLIRAITTIFSPLECIIDNLNREINKIFPAVNEVTEDLGFGPLTEPINLRTGSAEVRRMISDIQKERIELENKILTFINEKTKSWELKIWDENEALDLYIDLDRYARFVGMLYEIIDLVSVIKDATKSGMTEKEKQEAYQKICSHSIVYRKPWIDLIPVDLDGDDGNSFIQDIDNNIDNGEDPSNGYVPPVWVVYDDTVGDNFFDGDDITTVLDDETIEEIINNLNYDDTTSGGQDPLTLDQNLIDNYRQTKNRFKNLRDRYKNLKPIDKDQHDTIGFVVGTVDFAECLNRSNLQNYSQEQLNSWINKITG